MNKLLLSLLLALGTLCAQAQSAPTRALTLEECVTLAQEYSASALIARQTFLTAYWRYRAYRAEYLPSLRAEGALPQFHRRLSRYQLPNGEYTYLRENANTLSGRLSLNQNIGATGTRLFLRSSLERHDLLGERRTTDYVTLPVQVGLEHSFFAVNTLKWKRKIEPKRYEEAKRLYLQTIEQLAQEGTERFFNLLFAQQRLATARLNRANADTLFQIAKGRYNIGTIAENDLLQMELNLLNETNSVSEGEVALQHAQFQLVTFLGLQTGIEWQLIPPAPYEGDTVSYPTMLACARRNHPTPLRLELQTTEAAQGIAEAKAARGFQVNVSASYGLTQQGQTLGDAYQSPLDQQGVSLNFAIPLLDWGQGAGRLKMARSNYELTQVRGQQALHEFEQQLFLQVMRYNRQPSLLYIAAKADTIAQNRFRIAKQRFLIGKISVLDLDKAQIDRDEANSSYLRAVRDSWLTYYQLRALTLVDPKDALPLTTDFEKLLK